MKRAIATAVAIVGLALVPAALAAGGLHGTYKEKITSKTLDGGNLFGTWTIKFKGGVYTVRDGGHFIVSGAYTLAGSDLTIVDKTGPGKCTGTGKYSIKLSGSSLTFAKISDPCTSRADVVTFTTWMKV